MVLCNIHPMILPLLSLYIQERKNEVLDQIYLHDSEERHSATRRIPLVRLLAN